MKKLMLFWIECLLKVVFILASLFFMFVLPYYIMDIGIAKIAIFDLVLLYLSVGTGITLFKVTDVFREEYARGIGLFCTLKKYEK